MAPTPTLQEIIDSVRHDTPTGNALAQLRGAAATVAELSEVGDEALGYFVDRARRSGHTWTDISAALGVTRQAAHKRFAAATRPPGLDQFTARALRVVAAAADVARDLGHPYVGTEHLLLCLYAEEGGVARAVLTGAGIDRDAVEQAVLHRVPRRDETPEPPLPHTARAAAVLEATVREALQLGHSYIGTEHLLLAFYAEPVVAATAKPEFGYRRGGGMAAEILTELGLDRETARNRVVHVLASYTPDGGTGA
jgi:hypothetical protein